jgi:outer membrane protein insertion porin family
MKARLAALFLLGLAPVLAGQERVEKIEITGNERVTRETILYYLASREGDPFDDRLWRQDFKVLWSTGFFSNLRIESDPGKEGRIVKVIVEENPLVRAIAYRTGKGLKENDIVDKLKEHDEYILPYSYYSPSKVQKIRNRIEALLKEKGLSGGTIAANVDRKGKNEVGIVFQVKGASRSRVGEITLEGEPGLPRRILIGAMKDNKKHGLLSWISGKDTFKEDKLKDDLDKIKLKLQESGYMEARIGEPRIAEGEKRSIFLKKRKVTEITIPVWAGERYSVGDVKIEGNKLLASKALGSLVKLKPGETYSAKAREKALEKMGEAYRDFGYIYAQVYPVESLDPSGKRVHLTFNINEGEPAYLSRLEFKGNTFTKDKVIRRELLIREGDRFSLALFKNSILRLKQLGLVEIEKEPDIKPREDDPAQVDVTVNVRELQRNSIQFSAGYSGYDGTFVSMSYSTVNLLGTGEQLNLMAQYGKRIKNYSFGYTQPYVFELPMNAGFNVFDRSSRYPNLFDQESRGIDLNLSFRVKGFWMTNLTYGFQYLNVEAASTSTDSDYSYYNPYYYGGTYGYGHYYVGSLTTSVFRNTVDSPLTPSRGSLYLVGCKFAGGIFGGEVSLIKPQAEWTLYRPLVGKTVLGLHMKYEFIVRRGRSVPFWERFFLGGERSIRGYDIYSVGPLSDEGVNQGGEKSLVFNAEYIIPVGGPVQAVLFYDAGNAYARRETVSLKNLYTSTGLEVRLFVPALRVPFRLIFAYNNPTQLGSQSPFAFRFAVGTTF